MGGKSKKIKSIYFITIFLSCITVSKILGDSKVSVNNIIVTIAAIFGPLMIWYEIKNSKDLNEAEFIFNLNQSFFSNKAVQELYIKLENSKNIDSSINICNLKISTEDTPIIVQYITYFYSIQCALDKGIIDMKTVNTIFSYRFFLIVHNRQIQDMELIKDDIYYKNIYILHNYWTKYRKKMKQGILNEKNSLCKRNPNYYKLIKYN